jgi:hypothetical protein
MSEFNPRLLKDETEKILFKNRFHVSKKFDKSLKIKYPICISYGLAVEGRRKFYDIKEVI